MGKGLETKSESLMVRAIADFLLSTKKYSVYFEVPNMGQSVDIVATTRDGFLITIEAKVNQWKRGFQQCLAHNMVADFVVLAIATKKINKDLESTARKLGYGLIQYDFATNGCSLIVKPKQNKKFWKPQRQVFYNYIEKQLNAS